MEGLSFTDAALQLQVNLVLSRLGENRGRQERELEIALSGSAGGTVGLGYLAEMPLWKASYRLVARSGDGLLQGWAILENASGQDWRDVQVTLIGGSPRALRQALFASYFVPRPEVPVLEAAPEAGARVRPRDGDGSGPGGCDAHWRTWPSPRPRRVWRPPPRAS